MENLIKEIKKKKELRSLPDSLVNSVLNNVMKNRTNILSEKNKKIIIKEARAQLRIYTGQYTSRYNIKNREKLLKYENFKEILKEHTSTKERLKDYPLVKKIINKISPKIILDLGCGINPLAIASKGIEYHAYDVNAEDLKIINKFFKSKNMQGYTYHKDITKEESFPKADLCIIFKVLDILGKDKVKISKKLLTEIDSRFFLISFATKTLSGKPMSVVYRRWFEKILKNLNYSYEVKRTSQELFYLVEKLVSAS